MVQVHNRLPRLLQQVLGQSQIANLWRGARKSFALILCSDGSCGDAEAVAALAPYALVRLSLRAPVLSRFSFAGELPEVTNFRIFFSVC